MSNQPVEQSHLLNSYRPGKKTAWFFLLCVSVFGGFLAWQALQERAVGTVWSEVPPSQPRAVDAESEKRLYSGKYLYFSHLAKYTERRHDLPDGNVIKETLLLSTNDIEGRKIALVVANREGSSLSDDPSFRRRSDSPQEYQAKPFTIGDFSGTLFIKKDVPFEVTAFFRQNNDVVSLSLTSPFTLEGLEEELIDIVASFRLFP